MKSSLSPAAGLIAALSIFVSGCMHGPSHGHHDASPNSAMPASKSAMSHGSKMDRATMCEVYRTMTPEERQAMREAHHPDMSPEMQKQHESMMQQTCADSSQR